MRRCAVYLITLCLAISCGVDSPTGPGDYIVPSNLPDPDEQILYKTVSTGAPLDLHLFYPDAHSQTDNKPAIIFYFGGGWRTGHPRQYYQQAKYLATRGMVAICAEYRTTNSHGVTPLESVADAKSAVRWIRAQAGSLGINPDRIAVSGGSAGGHLSACTALIDQLDDEATTVSARPDAMVLFNPVLDLDKPDYHARLGADWSRISPMHHIRHEAPPTLILHGTADTQAPFKDAANFTQLMRQQGNSVTLVPYNGKTHGWYNFTTDQGGDAFRNTLLQADIFFMHLGWLTGDPTIQ
jgi:acetyl esterase